MLVEKLKEAIAELELILRDAEKADSGNHSAGVRLRKDLKKCQDKMQEIRKDVVAMRKEKE